MSVGRVGVGGCWQPSQGWEKASWPEEGKLLSHDYFKRSIYIFRYYLYHKNNNHKNEMKHSGGGRISHKTTFKTPSTSKSPWLTLVMEPSRPDGYKANSCLHLAFCPLAGPEQMTTFHVVPFRARRHWQLRVGPLQRHFSSLCHCLRVASKLHKLSPPVVRLSRCLIKC